jgi:hypothetical protein
MARQTKALELKALLILAVTAVAIASAIVPLVGTRAMATGSAATQTAQGIMVNLDATGTFAVVNNVQYRYNTATAAAYFTNTRTSGPSVACSGSAANCAATNQPAAPTPPAPDPARVDGADAGSAVNLNQCAFLNGGTLAGLSPYTQPVTINGQNGKGNWTFTWTYTVAPDPSYDADPDTAGVQVGELTAWDFVRSDVEAASVALNARIAGESVLFKSPSYKKYSFSLLNSDGTSRVQNLHLSVTDSGNNTVLDTTPGSVISAPVDFTYTTNAGTNGAAVQYLANGDARGILNTDSFPGNDNGGADGSALALATMETQNVSLSTGGDYDVTLRGTVKDNSGNTSIPFNVLSTLHLVTPGCGGSGT